MIFFCRFNKNKCVKTCILSPGITVGVGYCKFRYSKFSEEKIRSQRNSVRSQSFRCKDDRYNAGQLYKHFNNHKNYVCDLDLKVSEGKRMVQHKALDQHQAKYQLDPAEG